LSQHTTEDLRRDIENMENEKEQISKRLDRLKKKVCRVLKFGLYKNVFLFFKVERLNNTNSMLELSHNYRKETERERKIIQQKAELHNLNVQLDQKTDRLERTLKEQQSSFHDLNAESKNSYLFSSTFYFILFF
jgi:intraflagellar transport protein 81